MNEKPIIDVSHFQEAGISNAHIVEFLELYVAEMTTLPERFQKLMTAKDFKAGRQLLHSLKGASEVIGAYRMSTLVQQLEILLKLDELPVPPDFVVEQFKHGLEITQIGITQLIHELMPLDS